MIRDKLKTLRPYRPRTLQELHLIGLVLWGLMYIPDFTGTWKKPISHIENL